MAYVLHTNRGKLYLWNCDLKASLELRWSRRDDMIVVRIYTTSEEGAKL